MQLCKDESTEPSVVVNVTKTAGEAATLKGTPPAPSATNASAAVAVGAPPPSANGAFAATGYTVRLCTLSMSGQRESARALLWRPWLRSGGSLVFMASS